MSAEWYCEGCGYLVAQYGISEPPEHQLCAICGWVQQHVPTEHVMLVRRAHEPGGSWEPERARRPYVDVRMPERACDYCGSAYRGPAVYCSLTCAQADA